MLCFGLVSLFYEFLGASPRPFWEGCLARLRRETHGATKPHPRVSSDSGRNGAVPDAAHGSGPGLGDVPQRCDGSFSVRTMALSSNLRPGNEPTNARKLERFPPRNVNPASRWQPAKSRTLASPAPDLTPGRVTRISSNREREKSRSLRLAASSDLDFCSQTPSSGLKASCLQAKEV